MTVEPPMSVRARLYLAVAAVHHLILGGALLGYGAGFGSPAFQALFAILPRVFWGVALLAVGVHLACSAIVRSGGHARAALISSAALGLMWAGAFGIVVLHGATGILATVIFTALALRDLIVCAQPLRSPFEVLEGIYGGSPLPPTKG